MRKTCISFRSCLLLALSLTTLPPALAQVPPVPPVPTGLRPLGKLPLPDILRGLALRGTTAAVVNYNRSLSLVDIRNPKQPRLLGRTALAGYPQDVALGTTVALVTSSEPDAVEVFDIRRPAAPRRVGAFRTAHSPYDVVLRNATAYVTYPEDTLVRVLDVRNPAAVRELAHFRPAGAPTALALRGTVLAVTSSANVLQLYDVANPAAPLLRGTTATARRPLGVALRDSLAAVVFGGDNIMQLFDVRQPKAPRLVSSPETEWGARGVVLGAGTAYVRFEENVYGFDVRVPARPRPLGSQRIGSKSCAAAAGSLVCTLGDDDRDGGPALRMWQFGPGPGPRWEPAPAPAAPLAGLLGSARTLREPRYVAV